MPRRHQPPTRLVAAGLLALGLTGCGGGSGDADPRPASRSPTQPPAGGATGTSAGATAGSASPGPSAPSSAAGSPACRPPHRDVSYGVGSSLLSIIRGPGRGIHQLTLRPDPDDPTAHGYRTADGELRGTWTDGAGHTLTIDIEGADPCVADAFVSIRVNAQQTFVDSSHRACDVDLTDLSRDAAAGFFDCHGLAGGGAGVMLEANGDFSLIRGHFVHR